MTAQPNLLQFLAEPVHDYGGSDKSTVITETDGDEYDAPDHMGFPLSTNDRAYARQTMESRDDQDTYDNDANVVGLGVPGWMMQTQRTSFTGETYDNDIDTVIVGMPASDYDQTTFTKVEGETSDDNLSIESLSFPSQ